MILRGEVMMAKPSLRAELTTIILSAAWLPLTHVPGPWLCVTASRRFCLCRGCSGWLVYFRGGCINR